MAEPVNPMGDPGKESNQGTALPPNQERGHGMRSTPLPLRPLVRPLARALGNSRGDVPGWVLVTVMTAGLVTTLWVLADGTFSDVFSRAVQSVSRS